MQNTKTTDIVSTYLLLHISVQSTFNSGAIAEANIRNKYLCSAIQDQTMQPQNFNKHHLLHLLLRRGASSVGFLHVKMSQVRFYFSMCPV